MRRKSAKEHVEEIKQQRLIYSEYRRGFMEGQHQAVLEFASCIDRLLKKYDHIAVSGDCVIDK